MFEDGYYFGQGKLICLAETDSDNGKIVTVKNESNTRTWTAHIADKKCEFILPPKDRYSIELGEGEYITKVDMSYGACIGVHLADGYGNVLYNDLLTLEEITAATDLSFKGASAESVNELNNNFGNMIPFSFGITPNGEYGYKKVGADTVIPFRNYKNLTAETLANTGIADSMKTYSFTTDQSYKMLIILMVGFDYNGSANITNISTPSSCASYILNKSNLAYGQRDAASAVIVSFDVPKGAAFSFTLRFHNAYMIQGFN